MDHMHMRIHVFRFSTIAPLLAASAVLVAACGGGGDDDVGAPTPGAITNDGQPIPTATPYARVPEPTIVSGVVASAPASSEVTYLVEAGDTLSGIAERFETTVDAIMAQNELSDPTLIFVGQELTIPAGEVLAAAAPAPGDDGGGATASQSGLDTYEVQPGDTALAIAFQFDVTLEELAAANGTSIDALNNLQVGDTLVIPS